MSETILPAVEPEKQLDVLKDLETYVASAIVCVDVARNFGKGTVFGVGLWLFPYVLFPVLGFGDATYNANIEG